MEDGPAKRTRSATSIEKNESQPFLGKNITLSGSESDIFRTPTNSPIKAAKAKKRAKTPSGNIVSNSVKDIRNFFLLDKEKEKEKVSELCSQLESHATIAISQSGVLQNQSTVQVTGRNQPCISALEVFDDNHSLKSVVQSRNSVDKQSANVTAGSNKCASVNYRLKEHSDSLGVNFACIKAMAFPTSAVKNLVSENVQDLREKERIYRQKRQKKINYCLESAESDSSKTASGQNMVTTQLTADEHPSQLNTTIDAKIVYEMFHQLKQDIVGNKIPDGEHRLTQLENRQDVIMDTLFDMKEELIEYKTRTHILSGVVSHLSQVVGDMSEKLENIKLENMRKSAVLTGLLTSQNKGECIQELKYFLETEMKISCEIDDIFFLSKECSSPMVIKFSSQKDKRKVFSNLGRLKGLINENNKPFFFSHYLPAQINEKRKREDSIWKENEALDVQKVDMSRKAGKLYIEDIPYQKKVVAPTVAEILALSTEHFNMAMDTKVTPGDEVLEQGDKFIAYAMSTDDHESIRNAYVKLKVSHASARHILCAYRIPGTKSYENEDYYDDGETACGNTLLQWMKDNSIECKAIFIARYQSGGKIGAARHSAYIQAARNAIKSDPVNDINGINQFQKMEEYEKANASTSDNTYSKKTTQMSRRHNVPRQSLSQWRGQQHRRQNRYRGQNAIRGGYKSTYYPTKPSMVEEKNTYEEQWPTPQQAPRKGKANNVM